MKDLKALKDLMTMLEGYAEKESNTKRVIVSIDTESSKECGCVGVKLENIDKGSDLAIASAALLASCLERSVEGKEEETLLLILFLATEIFGKGSDTEEDAIKNGKEKLRKLENFFSTLGFEEEDKDEE